MKVYVAVDKKNKKYIRCPAFFTSKADTLDALVDVVFHENDDPKNSYELRKVSTEYVSKLEENGYFDVTNCAYEKLKKKQLNTDLKFEATPQEKKNKTDGYYLHSESDDPYASTRELLGILQPQLNKRKKEYDDFIRFKECVEGMFAREITKLILWRVGLEIYRIKVNGERELIKKLTREFHEFLEKKSPIHYENAYPDRSVEVLFNVDCDADKRQMQLLNEKNSPDAEMRVWLDLSPEKFPVGCKLSEEFIERSVMQMFFDGNLALCTGKFGREYSLNGIQSLKDKVQFEDELYELDETGFKCFGTFDSNLGSPIDDDTCPKYLFNLFKNIYFQEVKKKTKIKDSKFLTLEI